MDPIETKLSVQSDQWEAGFAAARRSAKHFGDDVESTTERVKEKLESLKSSFGRRGLLGEGLETLMGGGAIAGFGIALEAVNKLKEGVEEIITAAKGEEEMRDEIAAKTNLQAIAMEAVSAAQGRINQMMMQNLEMIDKSQDERDRFAAAGEGDPLKRQRAEIGIDYSQKEDEARKANRERQDKAMEEAAKAVKKINEEAEKSIGEETNKRRERGPVDKLAAWVGRGGAAEGPVGTGVYEAANELIHKVEEARKNEDSASERSLNLQLGLIEKEKKAKLESLAAEAQGKLQYQVDSSKDLREFSGGDEAAGLRAKGADDAEIKSAYELQKQVQDELITKEQRGAVIAEQMATKKAEAERQVVAGINSERASQDALIQTLQRGAIAGGQVNKVLDQMALHHLPAGAESGLLAEAQAADTAAEHFKDLAKAFSSVREIEKESANLQALLSRGVDVRWVTQLAGMGAAAMNADQLNEAILKLEQNEAMAHLVQREKQAEDGVRSLEEKVGDLQSLLDKGVDAKYIQQLAGMGALDDKQIAQVEGRLSQEEKINNVINARRQIEEQTIALRAKQMNESVEEYKLRQQGNGSEADKLKQLEMIGKQIDANRQLAEREAESRNQESTKDVRNHYAAIQSLNEVGSVTIPGGGAGNGQGITVRAGLKPIRGAPGIAGASGAKEPSKPADDKNTADPILMSWLRDIRNATLDNLAQVAQF